MAIVMTIVYQYQGWHQRNLAGKAANLIRRKAKAWHHVAAA